MKIFACSLCNCGYAVMFKAKQNKFNFFSINKTKKEKHRQRQFFGPSFFKEFSSIIIQKHQNMRTPFTFMVG